jgi:hypothetical protein
MAISVERHLHENQRLERAALQLLSSLEVSGQPQAVTRQRHSFAFAFCEHCANQVDMSFSNLSTPGNAEMIGVAKNYHRDRMEIRERWTQHLSEWCDDVIEADWPIFVAELQQLIESTTSYLAREIQRSIPVALAASVIPLRRENEGRLPSQSARHAEQLKSAPAA